MRYGSPSRQPPAARHGQATILNYAATGTASCPRAALLALYNHTGVTNARWPLARISLQPSGEQLEDAPLTRAGLLAIERRLLAAAAAVSLDEHSIGAVVDAIMAPRPAELRDRSLLLSGLSTAARRSNLCELFWRNCKHDRRGIRLTFERTKTDQAGAGTDLWLPKGKDPDSCPVHAWHAWSRHVAALINGDPLTALRDQPVFPAIDRHGNVKLASPLTGEALAEIIKRRVAAAGYDPELFSGHSLRSGFITSAAEAGARIDQIQRVSGHRNIGVLVDYIRRVDGWKNNPAALIGL